MKFGLSLAIPVAQSMDIVIGAAYAQQGDSGTASGNVETADERPDSYFVDIALESNYIKVPVLARYTYAPVNVFAGPYVGILVDCGLTSSFEGATVGLECHEESALEFQDR